MIDSPMMTIQNFIDETLFKPDVGWPKYEFQKRSYARWAANEILDRIIQEEMRLPPHITGVEPLTPLQIIQGFMMETDYFAGIAENKHDRFIFTTARDTAENLIYLFS